MLAKVYRDLARLCCLKRDKVGAISNHETCMGLIQDKVFPGISLNIKIAKLSLLKGVWLSKLDTEQSNEQLTLAFH